MSSSSGSSSVASNILVNHDFSSPLASWRANNCRADVVRNGQGGNYAVVTDRKEKWQGLEQDITGKVSAGVVYSVYARVRVSGHVQSSDGVEATLRLESRDSEPDYETIIPKTFVSSNQWQTLEGNFSLSTLPNRKIVFYLEGPPPGVDLFIDSVLIKRANPAYGVNIITNRFNDGSNGWFPRGSCNLSVQTDSNSNRCYILATGRKGKRDGPAQQITDKLQLFLTYQLSASVQIGSWVSRPQRVTVTLRIDDKERVNVGQVEVNGDNWHEIVGSFRIERKPAKVVVYVHGPDSGVDLMLRDEIQISVVDRKARFEKLRRKTDKVRKRDVVLKLYGPGSSSLPAGTYVSVEQTRNSFPIGSCISHTDIEKENFVDFFVKHFNWAVFQYELKWDHTEEKKGNFDYEKVDELLAFCHRHRIKTRGHCIFWEEKEFIQEWVQALSDSDLRKAIRKRLEDLLTRYKGKFEHYDVNNEMLHETYYRERLGDKIRVTMYKTAKKLDPDAKLFVNDYHIEDGRDAHSTPEKYIKHIRELRARGAPVEGVGIQGHVRSPVVGEIVCSALDKFVESKLGLPIWFTELDFSHLNERFRADDLEVMLREAFAHRAVEGIMFWGNEEAQEGKKKWNNAHWWNAKGDLNEAGRRLLALKEEWMSNEKGKIDNGSEFKFRGFPGHYKVYVQIGSKRIFKVFEVPKGESPLEVPITFYSFREKKMK